jgi:starvation-inducible DNA-binding protein
MAPATKSRLFENSIDINQDKRIEIIDILNERLADSLDLRSQVKQAHWNVKGLQFLQVHELFDDIAEHTGEAIDLIAERATALGGVANGTVRQAANASSLQEYDLNAVTVAEHLRAVAQRLAAFANAAREAIDQTDELGDRVTADLFTQIVRQADKDLWFVEAHLQSGSATGQLRKAG